MTTTSSAAYVWAWLADATDPIPVGVLRNRAGQSGLSFRYGDRYASTPGAIPLYGLPFDGPDWRPATHNLGMPAAIRDASPDNWGRRVILQRLSPNTDDTAELSELTYLLESGSNRLGAIDFQATPSEYVARRETATLEELLGAATLVEQGTPLPAELDRALRFGTAIGGARPKALLTTGRREFIAKFSSSTDPYDVVGAEAAAIYLAERAGIPVTTAEIAHSLGKKVLLLERFDRPGQGTRRMVVSALTMLGLPETFYPIGSYPAIVDALRKEGAQSSEPGAEVFRRAAFNIAIGNTDDHLRNHAAFWDGSNLELTPAYDLSPVLRTGASANQAISLARDSANRTSSFATLVQAAKDYGLDQAQAHHIVDEITDVIRQNWLDAAQFGEISKAQQELLFGRAILNPGSTQPTPRKPSARTPARAKTTPASNRGSFAGKQNSEPETDLVEERPSE